MTELAVNLFAERSEGVAVEAGRGESEHVGKRCFLLEFLDRTVGPTAVIGSDVDEAELAGSVSLGPVIWPVWGDLAVARGP
jgi:hypothetical protein